MKKLSYILAVLLFLAACGSGYGIYHRVGPGETFDSISSAYGVSPETLVRYNNVTDRSAVKMGDALYIPGADRQISAKAERYSTSVEPETSVATPSPGRIEPEKRSRVKTTSLPPKKGGFIWPLKGKVLSKFGSINGELHDGIDVAAKVGTPVAAAAAGRVIYSGSEIKGYGNLVIIKHAGSYSTVYAHNSKNMVDKGTFVKAGDLIALAGNSGRSSMPALHFEIREGKKARDPLLFLK